MIELESIGPAEDAVIRLLHTRLAAGKECYGPLDPDDGRDWMAETSEELADATVYLLIKVLTNMNREGWGK
jgi:hypothetical protein